MTNDELLFKLDCWNCHVPKWDDSDDKAKVALRAIIENRPKEEYDFSKGRRGAIDTSRPMVDEKFVVDLIGFIAGKSIDKWHPDYLKLAIEGVVQRLQAAGMDVKEEKE